MQANLEGQLALTEKLKFERNAFANKLEAREKDAEKLESQLVATRKKFDKVNDEYDHLESYVKKYTADEGELVLPEPGLGFPAWWLAVGALLIGLMGCAAGYAFGRREDGFVPETNTGQPSASPAMTDSAFENEIRSSSDAAAKEKVTALGGDDIALTIDGDDSPAPPPKK